ncbi:acetate/propionate family kinase, partial [Acinetobacter baumannii]
EQELESLAPLAPLHQPQNLRLIRAIGRLRPGLPQTTSFDTAFHATQDALARRFALPRKLHDEGVLRYGFHGISYRYIASELRRRQLPEAHG